jgi:hypothetical protein
MRDRFVFRAAAFLFGVAGIAALLLSFSQEKLPRALFEFDNEHAYRGAYSSWPYPALLDSTGTRYWLVAPGKHGLPFAAQDGRFLRLRGALIERGSADMIQVAPGSIVPDGGQSEAPVWTDLGEFTLRGEIADSKCWLGVMNPGQGKVHRDCAVRCISGGIPPAFFVRDPSGRERVLLMTGADGRKLSKELLDYVAEPIQATGHVARSGDSFVFETEVSTFVRLSH